VKPTNSIARRLGYAGAILLVVGTGLLGTAVAASAAGATLTITPPTTGLTNPTLVTVGGTGFGASQTVKIFQCNLSPGEPTIDYNQGGTDYGQLPVGCGAVTQVTSKPTGKFSGVFAGIQGGALGPPGVGTDSSGGDATLDAKKYPCPVYVSQATAGGSCALLAVDGAGNQASANFQFTQVSQPDPTTTTAPKTTCTPASGTASAKNPKTGTTGTVTVNPATCLYGGAPTTVTASGLVASSLGSILECNSDAAQPTVTYLGAAIPVSCTAVKVFSTSPTGTIGPSYQAFNVVVGTTGPPCSSTCTPANVDSAGNPPATDAAKYPCPPTPAQVTAGDHCVIAVGDLAGDQVAVPIAFDASHPSVTPSGGGTTTTAVHAATAASGSLAFTGPGTGLRLMGLLGAVLIAFGLAIVVIVDGPRRLLSRLARREVESDGRSD